MQIKRFFAKDTHRALRKVREAMGPDAVIISNRQVEDGVEILASGDYDDSRIDIPAQADAPQAAAVAEPARRDPDQDKVIRGMREEIHQLKNLMESQLGAMKVGQWAQHDEVRAHLFRQFSRLGLGADLITRFVSATAGEKDLVVASRKALALLAKKLKITDRDLLEEGGVAVLIGPTGAGKTTTIAKLAARFVMEQGADGVVMISADNRRIGAHEQLLAFGKLLGIPVLHAREPRELDSMLAALADKKLVLVDSAGMDQADLQNPGRLPGFNNRSGDVRHYLVLPATMQRVAMDRILSVLRKAGIAGCILTKVDEAAALGDAFTSLLRHRVPVAYWTDGQRIEKDLYRADAGDLVSRAVRLSKARHVNKDDRLMLAMLKSAGAATELRH